MVDTSFTGYYPLIHAKLNDSLLYADRNNTISLNAISSSKTIDSATGSSVLFPMIFTLLVTPSTLHLSAPRRGDSHRAESYASNVQESVPHEVFVDKKESGINAAIQELGVKEGYWRSVVRLQQSLITETYNNWDEEQSKYSY
jgi:hypothetical protein